MGPLCKGYTHIWIISGFAWIKEVLRKTTSASAPQIAFLLFSRHADSRGVSATKTVSCVPAHALTPAFSLMPSHSRPCSLTTNKQSTLPTPFQLRVLSDARYPHTGLLAGQRRRRKGSKLERATPEGIILVLWHVEGQLFASCIVTSRAWERERRETDYSD